MSAYAQRALIGGLPRTPFTWDAFLRVGQSRPAGIVVAKSALFRTPKYGHPSWRSLAPPPPTKPASLGFGGGPKVAGPSCRRGTGPCRVRNLKCLRCTHTACLGKARVAGPSSRAHETSAPTHVTRSLFVGAGVLTGPHGAVRLFVGAAFRRPPRRAEPQRRNAVSQNVLLPTFLERKVGR